MSNGTLLERFLLSDPVVLSPGAEFRLSYRAPAAAHVAGLRPIDSKNRIIDPQDVGVRLPGVCVSQITIGRFDQFVIGGPVPLGSVCAAIRDGLAQFDKIEAGTGLEIVLHNVGDMTARFWLGLLLIDAS